MRILLVGAGGVGTAFARIAARRPFAELVIADYDLGRAQRAAAALDGYEAVPLDARDEQATAALLTEHSCDVLMNATDPRFVMPLFRAALTAGTHYLDMAMSLSRPHPDEPYAKTGVKLGDEQFAMAQEWERSGRLALVGLGCGPGGSRSSTASATSSSAYCRACTSSAWTAPTRSAPAASACHRGTWSRPACPTRPPSVTR